MWPASLGANFLEQGEFLENSWGNILTLTSLTTSMVVNALTTGLIVFRIFNVFREVKDNATSDEKALGATGGKKLRSIIFVIVESGMALFAIQLTRLVLTVIDFQGNVLVPYSVIVTIHEMLNVIISSAIVTLCFTHNMDLGRV